MSGDIEGLIVCICVYAVGSIMGGWRGTRDY